MKEGKILNLVLFLGCCVFAYMAFFQENPGYKKRMKELDQANARLKAERDSIDKVLVKLDSDYTKLVINAEVLAKEVKFLDAEVDKSRKDAAKSQIELAKIIAEITETRKKIEEHKKNPPNRTGDDLINSLKIKTMP